jgi:hypothetical protein
MMSIIYDTGLQTRRRRHCSWYHLLQVQHAIDYTEKYRPAAHPTD